jgi:hypothetical protein
LYATILTAVPPHVAGQSKFILFYYLIVSSRPLCFLVMSNIKQSILYKENREWFEANWEQVGKFGSDHRSTCKRVGRQVNWAFVLSKFPFMSNVYSENAKNGREQCKRFADKYDDGKSKVLRNNTIHVPSYGWNCDRLLADWFVAELSEGRKVTQGTAAVKMASIVPEGSFKTKGWKNRFSRFKIRNNFYDLTTSLAESESKLGLLDARLHSAKCYTVEKMHKGNYNIVTDYNARMEDVSSEKLRILASTRISTWWRSFENVKVQAALSNAIFVVNNEQAASKIITIQTKEDEHHDELVDGMMRVSDVVHNNFDDEDSNDQILESVSEQVNYEMNKNLYLLSLIVFSSSYQIITEDDYLSVVAPAAPVEANSTTLAAFDDDSGELMPPNKQLRTSDHSGCIVAQTQRLQDDALRLSTKELKSVEFDLKRATPSDFPVYDELYNLIHYDSSVSDHLKYAPTLLSQQHDMDSDGCINATSTKQIVMWFTAGLLLIDSAVVANCDDCLRNSRCVLCTTALLSLKFGMDGIFMGPVVQVGARKPHNSNDCTLQYYPLAFSTDSTAEKATFILDLWLVPDMKKRTVSVLQVKESHTVNNNRLIFRRTNLANWVVIQPEVPVQLTDGCSFYLECFDQSTLASQHRREVFTFLGKDSYKNENSNVVTDFITTRFYKATVTGERTAPLILEEKKSILRTVRLNWTDTKIKRFWGNGINNFNEHFGNFGTEYLGGICNTKNERKLHYEIITVDMVNPPPNITKRLINNRQSVLTNKKLFFWAVLDYMYKMFPLKNWVIFEVVGDGNCLFHCIAAWFAVMYPNKQSDKEHYYDWWRQQSCDALVTCVDQNCPHDNSLSILEYFMRLEHCDDSFNGDAPDILDIEGINTLPRLVKSLEEGGQEDESNDDYSFRVAQYRNECINNRELVRTRYLSVVQAARTAGIFNTEMQLLGLAIACKHVLNVCMFDVSICEIGQYVTDMSPYNVDVHKEEIYVFYNPFDAAKHYISVGHAEKVAGFCKPDQPPAKRMIEIIQKKKTSKTK